MINEEINRIVYQWREIWDKCIETKNGILPLDTSCIEIFKQYLPKNGLILEGGAGLGQWVIYLSNIGYKIVGIEIVPECVQRFKKKYPELKMYVGNVLELNYPDNTFDGYLSLGVIEHFIEGPDRVLKEAYRVLKPDGVFIVSVPAYNLARKIIYPLINFINPLKENEILRKIFNRKKLNYNSEIKKLSKKYLDENINKNYYPMIGIHPEYGLIFTEYRYKKGQLEEVLSRNKFKVIICKPISYEAGLKEILEIIGINIDFGSNLLKLGKYFGYHFFNHMYIAVAKPVKN